MAQDFQRQMDDLWGHRKTVSRAVEKEERKKTRAQVVTETRARVFALDKACICGSCKPDATDEMHEVQSRAKLRGRPPEEIFNVENCVRLSRRCHRLVTGELGKGKGLRLKFLDKRGAMGRVELVWNSGRRVVYVRSGR